MTAKEVTQSFKLRATYDRKERTPLPRLLASHPQDFFGGSFGVYRHTSQEAFSLLKAVGVGLVRLNKKRLGG